MVNKEFVKHLRSEISNMEQELECPVCLEVNNINSLKKSVSLFLLLYSPNAQAYELKFEG